MNLDSYSLVRVQRGIGECGKWLIKNGLSPLSGQVTMSHLFFLQSETLLSKIENSNRILFGKPGFIHFKTRLGKQALF
jgi:hypothetical protein